MLRRRKLERKSENAQISLRDTLLRARRKSVPQNGIEIEILNMKVSAVRVVKRVLMCRTDEFDQMTREWVLLWWIENANAREMLDEYKVKIQ